MASHMSHDVQTRTRTSTRVHHLVLSDHELHTVAVAIEYALESGTFPANHQIHDIRRAVREGQER